MHSFVAVSFSCTELTELMMTHYKDWPLLRSVYQRLHGTCKHCFEIASLCIILVSNNSCCMYIVLISL